MTRRRTLSGMLVSVLLICLGAQLSARQPDDLVTLLPGERYQSDWVLDGEVETYDPANLFEYINGEAELFRDYDFVQMVTAYYIQSEQTSLAFSIDIFDMGSPLNAFGIYSMYRRPGLQFQELGEEGIVSATNVKFYKGKYFVQLNTASMDSGAQCAIISCARNIAAKISPASVPEELTWLPETDRMAHTLTYKTRGFMGLENFRSVVQADYRLGKMQCTGFLAIFTDAAEAQQSLQNFTDVVSRQGEILEKGEQAGEQRFLAETQFQGKILAQTHSGFIVGVMGYTEQSSAEELIQRIIQTAD